MSFPWDAASHTPITCFDDLSGFIKSDAHWIFRASPKQNLFSTFDRLCDRAALRDADKRRDLEAKLMREFMRAAHHYLEGPLPGRTDLAEWMSLARHYGSPSRLVDFTLSVYVALYFALHDFDTTDSSDSYIICLNNDWLARQVDCQEEGSLRTKIVSHAGIKDREYDFHNPKLFFAFVYSAWKEGRPCEPPFTGVAPVNSFRLNRRIIEQQGLFLCGSDAGKPFEDNLLEMFKDRKGEVQTSVIADSVRVLKLKRDLNFQKETMTLLKRMNISTRTLYPDLTGYAAALSDWAFYAHEWEVSAAEMAQMTQLSDYYSK